MGRKPAVAGWIAAAQPAGDATDIVTEATALRFARANGLAVPRVRGVRADTDPALCPPPEIDWFGDSVREQGRPDLSQQLLRRRRDDFLADAIERLETELS